MAQGEVNNACTRIVSYGNTKGDDVDYVTLFFSSSEDARESLDDILCPEPVKCPNKRELFTLEECDEILTDMDDTDIQSPSATSLADFELYAQTIECVPGELVSSLPLPVPVLDRGLIFQEWCESSDPTTHVFCGDYPSNDDDPNSMQFVKSVVVKDHLQFRRHQLKVDHARPENKHALFDRSTELVAWLKCNITADNQPSLIQYMTDHGMEVNPFRAVNRNGVPMLPLVFTEERVWCDPRKIKSGFTSCVSSCIKPQAVYWAQMQYVVKQFRKLVARAPHSKRFKFSKVKRASINCWKCGRGNDAVGEDLHTAETCTEETYVDGTVI